MARYLYRKPNDIHVLNRYTHRSPAQLILRDDIVRYPVERIDGYAAVREISSHSSPWWILNSQLGPFDVVEETVKEPNE